MIVYTHENRRCAEMYRVEYLDLDKQWKSTGIFGLTKKSCTKNLQEHTNTKIQPELRMLNIGSEQVVMYNAQCLLTKASDNDD